VNRITDAPVTEFFNRRYNNNSPTIRDKNIFTHDMTPCESNYIYEAVNESSSRSSAE
jgi:hypothetical protein